MESLIGVILLVIVVCSLIYFRKTITHTANYIEDVVSTNIAEEKQDLIERSMTAYEGLVEAFPEGFMTPQEILSLMNNKRKKVRSSGNK